jgi:hypothetical protein
MEILLENSSSDHTYRIYYSRFMFVFGKNSGQTIRKNNVTDKKSIFLNADNNDYIEYINYNNVYIVF